MHRSIPFGVVALGYLKLTYATTFWSVISWYLDRVEGHESVS